MRWHYLSELEEEHHFGIERLLGFVIRLQIINRNIKNTEVTGRQRLSTLVENIREGYKMPPEFEVVEMHGDSQSINELVNSENQKETTT
jgi:hypothetical protein